MTDDEYYRAVVTSMLWPIPGVHDFTVSRWGHHIENFKSRIGNVTGHGRGINVGHTVVIGKRKFKVEAIEYMRDPSDQFLARIVETEVAV